MPLEVTALLTVSWFMGVFFINFPFRALICGTKIEIYKRTIAAICHIK
jgi:hypothetical protein